MHGIKVNHLGKRL